MSEPADAEADEAAGEPAGEAAGEPAGEPVVIADEFLGGLRIAALGVTSVVLVTWFLPTALMSPDAYRNLPVEYGAMGVLLAMTVAQTVLVVLDRPWGRLRWPMVALALAATIAATAAVRPDQLLMAPHWSWKIFGWFAVLLLLDLPVGWFFGALGLQQLISLAQVLAVGQTDASTLVEMGVTSLLVASWQGAVALAAVALQRSGTLARQTAQEEARLRLTEQVAEQLHGDRQARYDDLAATTAPLLEGLASGRLDPADPQVQRACSVEAARMRRLFAESDDVTDPLAHEIHACVDAAERRGLAVQTSMRGVLPAVPLPVRRRLTEPVITALAEARSWARVTVVAQAGQVTLSVLTDGAMSTTTPTDPTSGPEPAPDCAPDTPDTPDASPDPGPAADGASRESEPVPEAHRQPQESQVRVGRLVSGDRQWLDVTWTPERTPSAVPR